MRGISWIFPILLIAMTAEAQTTLAEAAADRPRVEINVGAGAMMARGEHTPPHYNDWFSEGRYTASIGYYWTENFKTEIEFAHSGQGMNYSQEWVRVPGSGTPFLLNVEQFHRLQQISLRMVWQFYENKWVHPYVNGGISLDMDRTRSHVPEQFYYPGDPRVNPRQLVRPESMSNSRYEYGPGASFGGGAKFYMSPKTYLNTGAQFSLGDPFKTVTLLAGLGVEF